MNDILQNGFGLGLSFPLLSIGVGTFFACSGFNKLTNKARHAALVATLEKDRIPAVRFNQYWVPGWELLAGIMLALGVFPVLAAAVLLVICAVACFAEAGKRVAEYQPINGLDRWADYLYLPEVLYSLILLAIILR